MPQLRRRLRAIGKTDEFMNKVALAVVAEAKRQVPRKTGNLGRSITVGSVDKKSATVEVRAKYARWVEEGTGIYGPRKQKIVPKSKKALRWTGGGASRVRLSGRSRVVGGQALGQAIFAKSVKGRKATPFLRPAAEKVAKSTGLSVEIVKTWNKAA